SAKTSWSKGSVEQLIGDHYASCMDERRIDAAGLTPVQPLLAEIDALKDRNELLRMIGRFHDLAIPVPFGVVSSQDNHSPNDVIANVYASGRGLPDRDYYVKSEARFQEAREKYHAHVASIFKLAGASAPDADAAARAVFDMEKQLAEASLDNVALRDP